MPITTTTANELRSQGAKILNTVDVLTGKLECPTLGTLHYNDGIPFVKNSGGQSIKLIRFLNRNLKLVRDHLAINGSKDAIEFTTEQRMSEIATAYSLKDFRIFEENNVADAYNRFFRKCRMAGMEYLRSVGIPSSIAFGRMFSKNPLGSCMSARIIGRSYHDSHNIVKQSYGSNPVALYDAVNANNSTTLYRGNRYTVNVSMISGFEATNPKIVDDSCNLPMFRVLVWTLNPVDVSLPILRLVDKIYSSHADNREPLVAYLKEAIGVTHIREHHGLTDSSDGGEIVGFVSLSDCHKKVRELVVHVPNYRIHDELPYVDSFKYATATKSGLAFALSHESLDGGGEVIVMESTTGGYCEFDNDGCRCEGCGDFTSREDSYYSERLGESLCDSCYGELIVSCDSCYAEIAMQSDRYYSLPCGSISCDSCTTEH